MTLSAYMLAIDPGTFASGWVIMNQENRRPMYCGKDQNAVLLRSLLEYETWAPLVVIEMMTSYGAPVGRETLETCVWVGRFIQAASMKEATAQTMYRRDVKYELTDNARANDAMIRQYLSDRFAFGQPNHGKGTSKAPGWFYGFHDDIWQAYALGVAYLDREERERQRLEKIRGEWK